MVLLTNPHESATLRKIRKLAGELGKLGWHFAITAFIPREGIEPRVLSIETPYLRGSITSVAIVTSHVMVRFA